MNRPIYLILLDQTRDMWKESGPLIFQRHICCVGKLMNLNKILPVLWNFGPDSLFHSIAIRAQGFMKQLFIQVESMAYLLFYHILDTSE